MFLYYGKCTLQHHTSYSAAKIVLDYSAWEINTSVYFNKSQSEGVQIIFLCFLHTNIPLKNCTLSRSAG